MNAREQLSLSPPFETYKLLYRPYYGFLKQVITSLTKIAEESIIKVGAVEQ